MASPTQMHNVLCRSVTIEARFTASSRSSGSHIGIGPISTGPVTAESDERCGRRCMYRMGERGVVRKIMKSELGVMNRWHQIQKLSDVV
jgi:hypothetical protein